MDPRLYQSAFEQVACQPSSALGPAASQLEPARRISYLWRCHLPLSLVCALQLPPAQCVPLA